MRRTTASLLTAAVLASLAACGGGGERSNTEDKPKASPTASKKDRFLSAVRDADFESWTDASPTDEELLDYPPQWCEELEAGHSVEYLFDDTDGAALYPIGQEWGTEATEANELLVMGVSVYCPELREQVTADLRDSGDY